MDNFDNETPFKTHILMKLFLTLAFLAISATAYTQRDTFPTQRFYFSREQILDKAPEDTVTVWKLIERKVSEIKLGGGNDYKLEEGEDETVPRSTRLKALWATEYNDTLYLNGWHITKTKWYMKAETSGRYILLMTALPGNMQLCKQVGLEKELKAERKQAVMYGIAGGLGGGLGAGMAIAAGSSEVGDALSRYPVVYDLFYGVLCQAIPVFIAEQLSYYPTLSEKYETHLPDNGKMPKKEMLVTFINDLNTLEINPEASLEPLESGGHDILQNSPHDEENEESQP